MPLNVKKSGRSTRSSQLNSATPSPIAELRDNGDFMKIVGQTVWPRSDINRAFLISRSFRTRVSHPSLVCSNVGYQKSGLDLKPAHGGVPQHVILKITSVRQEQSVLRYATAN